MSSIDDTLAATGGASPQRRDDLVVTEGDQLGRYVVLSQVGAGTMGVVYAAFDPQLDRKVALKVMNPTLTSIAALTQKRMLREARALARISHPNVVAVYDVGTVHDRVFIAMEFVEGQSLDRWLVDQPGPWSARLAAMLEAGRGLLAAHEQGVAHCDFKPANVMLGSDGRIRVMDFGLAQAKRRAAYSELGAAAVPSFDVVAPSGAQGTPAYMAPEQYSAAGGAQADQFSFCVATWEALYGERPFDGQTPAMLLRATLAGELREAPASSPVPRWIRAALVRGLAPFPDQRYPSMAELLHALQSDPTRRRRALVIAGALGLLVAAAGGWWWAHRARIADECERSAEDLTAAWTPRARAELESALRGSELSYVQDTADRLMPLLDAYAQTLRERARASCRSARLEAMLPPDLYVRAQACFGERSAAFGGVLEGIDAAVPQSVREALSIAADLPSTEPCADPDWLQSATALLPDDAQTRARAVELMAELASLQSHEASTEITAGLQRSQEILEGAESIDWKPLITNALLSLGKFQIVAGDAEAAHESFMRAFGVATKAGRGDLAALSAALLARLLALRMGRLDEATVWAKVARAEEDDVSIPSGRWTGEVATALGVVAMRASDYDGCHEHFQRARTTFEQLYGTNNPNVANTMTNQAVCLLSSNRTEEGERLQREALTLLEQALGPQHPHVGITVLNRSISLAARGHYEAAREAAERAEAIISRSYGSSTLEARMARAQRSSILFALGRWEDARAGLAELVETEGEAGTGRLLINLAYSLAYLGRLDEAEAYAQQGRKVRAKAVGEDSPAFRTVHGVLAEIRLRRGDFEGARHHASRAVELSPDPAKAGDVELAEALRQLAAAQLGLGDRTEAIESATRSLEQLAGRLDDVMVAEAHFVLARALLPDHPSRAHTHAQQAIEIFRRRGGDFANLAEEVETWRSTP